MQQIACAVREVLFAWGMESSEGSSGSRLVKRGDFIQNRGPGESAPSTESFRYRQKEKSPSRKPSKPKYIRREGGGGKQALAAFPWAQTDLKRGLQHSWELVRSQTGSWDLPWRCWVAAPPVPSSPPPSATSRSSPKPRFSRGHRAPARLPCHGWKVVQTNGCVSKRALRGVEAGIVYVSGQQWVGVVGSAVIRQHAAAIVLCRRPSPCCVFSC